MREIRFRAWDKRFKKMVYDRPMAVLYKNDSDHEIMQFTGLHDKNGKEIYEGDIVRLDTPEAPIHKTRCLKIVFNQRFAQFCVDPCTSISHWPSVEVIGNIHETNLTKYNNLDIVEPYGIQNDKSSQTGNKQNPARTLCERGNKAKNRGGKPEKGKT